MPRSLLCKKNRCEYQIIEEFGFGVLNPRNDQYACSGLFVVRLVLAEEEDSNLNQKGLFACRSLKRVVRKVRLAEIQAPPARTKKCPIRLPLNLNIIEPIF